MQRQPSRLTQDFFSPIACKGFRLYEFYKPWPTALAEEAGAAVLVEQEVQDRATAMQRFHRPSTQGNQRAEHAEVILYHAFLEGTQF